MSGNRGAVAGSGSGPGSGTFSFPVLRRILVLSGLILLLSTMMLVNAGAGAQYMCPQAADPAVEEGWMAYRAGRIADAGQAFQQALGRCPLHTGGLVGLGYVSLREDATETAGELFDRVLAREPDVIDALVGRGIVAWRLGDLARMEEIFRRVGRLDPGNVESQRFLDLLEAPPEEEVPRPPERPPLVVPDTLEYTARAGRKYLEVRTDDGWAPFYVRGVNLGAALPGRFPSQYPDSATYARWLEQMAGLGANAVRVYVRHPPHFYGALRAHNLANPRSPLWLVHGVWAEPPPHGFRFDDPAWEAAFFEDVQATVDIVHGRADIPPRPGMAAGFYTADVSRWTLAYILAPELETRSKVDFNRLRPALSRWDGRFARITGATAVETWLTSVMDRTAAYETDRYNSQRPVAYTNWSHRHPVTGEPVLPAPTATRATLEFPAGTFAAYNAYPAHPEFVGRDPVLAAASSPHGPSSYWGHLQELRRSHPDQPVLVAEYGLPASIGVAGLNAQGWHHGGLAEDSVAAVVGRMTREIAAAGMAGGMVFSWIDEWFRSGWLNRRMESPTEGGRRWLNRLDAQEHFGIMAMEPEPRLTGATLAERLPAWRELPAAYHDPDHGELRLLADEAYLRVLYTPAARGPGGGAAGTTPAGGPDELLIGFDLLDPARGNFAWPGRAGNRLPVGVEAVLRVAGGTATMLKDAAFQPLTVAELDDAGLTDAGDDVAGRGVAASAAIASPPPGFFRGRYAMGRMAAASRVADDGEYRSARVVITAHRVARDSTETLAEGYDQGRLRRGPEPDGLWEVAGGAWEFRIPWQLLNVGDPSRRTVLLDDSGAWTPDGLAAVAVDGIRVVAAARYGDRWASLPASHAVEDVATFSWPTWDEPRWRVRARPTARALEAAWAGIQVVGGTD